MSWVVNGLTNRVRVFASTHMSLIFLWSNLEYFTFIWIFIGMQTSWIYKKMKCLFQFWVPSASTSSTLTPTMGSVALMLLLTAASGEELPIKIALGTLVFIWKMALMFICPYRCVLYWSHPARLKDRSAWTVFDNHLSGLWLFVDR